MLKSNNSTKYNNKSGSILESKSIIIRKYRPSDRTAVEQIHFDTGWFGKSMSNVIDEKKYFTSDAAYYLDKEPDSIFVAVYKKDVVGYLFGCLDDSRHNEIAAFIKNILVRSAKMPVMSKRDRKHWRSELSILVKNILGKSEEFKFKMPKNSGHIHINLKPEARGMGVGTRLINEFSKYAKKHGTIQIHADSFQTKLNPNTNFWLKNGFKVYSKVKTAAFSKYFPKEKICIVCYVKKL